MSLGRGVALAAVEDAGAVADALARSRDVAASIPLSTNGPFGLSPAFKDTLYTGLPCIPDYPVEGNCLTPWPIYYSMLPLFAYFWSKAYGPAQTPNVERERKLLDPKYTVALLGYAFITYIGYNVVFQQ